MKLSSRSSLALISIAVVLGTLSLFKQTFASEPNEANLPYLGPKIQPPDTEQQDLLSTQQSAEHDLQSLEDHYEDKGDFDATEEYFLEKSTNSTEMLQDILNEHTQFTNQQIDLVLEDLSLYGDFQSLKTNTRIELSFYNNPDHSLRLSRIAIQQSQYDRLRIEFPKSLTPSIIKDCFPLAVEVAKIDVRLSDFLTPNALTQQILDYEPNLLGYIDSQSNVTKSLKPNSKLTVLMKGRFRDEQLREVDGILAVNIEAEDEDLFIFHHEFEPDPDNQHTSLNNQPKGLWFSENLKPLSYPFIQHPTDHIIVSSDYGEVRSYEIHKGVDFAAPTGTPIRAAAAGIIKKSGYGTGYGAMVHINHPHLGEYSTVYAHLSKRFVKTGDFVHQGELIGYVGETGRATGPHLHYELRRKGHKINPYAKVVKRDFSYSYKYAEVKKTQSEVKSLMSSTNARMIGGLSYAVDNK
ncbi:MAG: hypothetical protein CMK59_06040 [Proteobacteria bacterium]|nr:hypothetical protein [Pseudomonadota bacterium]